MTVVLVGVLLVVAGIGALVLLPRHARTTRADAPPGPSQLPISPAFGQPPVHYGPVELPNACALLTSSTDVLRGRGWRLLASGAIREHLVDPVSQPPPGVTEASPGAEGPAACDIPFDAGADLHLDIEHATYNDPRTMSAEWDDFDSRARQAGGLSYQDQGWQVAIQPVKPDDPAHVSAQIRDADHLATLAITSPAGVGQNQAVDTARQVISRMIGGLRAAPQPPTQGSATYLPPFRRGPDVCSVLTDADVTQLYHQPASGMISRTWTEGVIPETYDNGALHDHIETECDRSAPDPATAMGNSTAAVLVQTYPDPPTAASAWAELTDPQSSIGKAAPPVPLGQDIGDGPAYLTAAFGRGDALAVRVGRHVVVLTGSERYHGLAPSDVRSRLAPLARQIADRLRHAP